MSVPHVASTVSWSFAARCFLICPGLGEPLYMYMHAYMHSYTVYVRTGTETRVCCKDTRLHKCNMLVCVGAEPATRASSNGQRPAHQKISYLQYVHVLHKCHPC